MARGNSWIGSPVARREDARFLTGTGQYVDDISFPLQAHAVLVRSTVAHGRLVRIDAAQARRMPGVIGILTAADVDDLPKIPMRMEPRPELLPFQQTVLASDRVRYVGEPLALVVAESIEQAHDAATCIAVDIETLPPLVDAHAAASHMRLFDGAASNIAMTLTGSKGDPDRAFRACDYTRKATFSVHRHTGSPMEARGVLARWDEATGRLTVYGAAKVPFAIRTQLARDLALPEAAIDVIENDVGGGFGIRGEYYPEDFLVPYAARRFCRPVKWVETRQEHLIAAAHARQTTIDLEIACMKDGTVVGLRGTATCDMGGYMRPNAMTAPRNLAQVMTGPYRVPAVAMQVVLAMTNKTPTASYRGPGRYEADFARERLFDMAACDLSIDPVEFRRRNLIGSAEMPYPFATVEPYGATGQTDSGDYLAAFDRCIEEIGWSRLKPQSGTIIDGRYHGIAAGCYLETGGSGGEHAAIHLAADAGVTVRVGSSGLGQGLETVAAQIAADALEVPLDAITHVQHGSTTLLASGSGSYASRTIVNGGNAIVAAAAKLREEVRALAARHLEMAAETVVLDGLTSAMSAGRSVAVRDLILQLAPEGVVAEGRYAGSERTYAYGTHAAHVAIDAATGEIEVLDYVVVEDVGRIINPRTLHSQTLGGVEQGLGGTLREELHYDADGQLLSGSLLDYAMPVASSFPHVRVISTEDWPSPTNPLGAKGAGEGGVIPVGGVIANAVAAALSSLGAEPNRLPLTPQRVWELTMARERA